jgi:hypothetical protein
MAYEYISLLTRLVLFDRDKLNHFAGGNKSESFLY